MKTLLLSMIIVVLSGCSHGDKFTKSVPPLPWNISDMKVMEIEDIKRAGAQGQYIGRGNFIRNMLINELRQSGLLIIEDDSPHQLIVRIEGYNPSEKYVALSAQILDISTNRIIWNASISGSGGKTIEEVTQNVVREMVEAMVKREKPDWGKTL